MQNVEENVYKRSFGMTQVVPSIIVFIGRLKVMQPDVNLNMTGRIVGCSIVYVLFLV